MRLQHLRLPGLVPYLTAFRIQERLVTQNLLHKADPDQNPQVNPTIITAELKPVYTCGRREVGNVTKEQQDYLREHGRAEFHEALRGGQTTFHGPGQLIAYPILDLKRHKLTPRTYVCLLEKSIIRTCATYGIKAMTTEHPGVWVTPDTKIAALGIHLRRNITSHGIGLNVNTDLRWFDRIVACGLEGKRTTSLQAEGVSGMSIDDVGQCFVKELALALEGVDGVETFNDAESLLDR